MVNFIQKLKQKLHAETLDVDSLKNKAREMLNSGQQTHAAVQAKEILDKLDNLCDRLNVSLPEYK